MSLHVSQAALLNKLEGEDRRAYLLREQSGSTSSSSMGTASRCKRRDELHGSSSHSTRSEAAVSARQLLKQKANSARDLMNRLNDTPLVEHTTTAPSAAKHETVFAEKDTEEPNGLSPSTSDTEPSKSENSAVDTSSSRSTRKSKSVEESSQSSKQPLRKTSSLDERLSFSRSNSQADLQISCHCKTLGSLQAMLNANSLTSFFKMELATGPYYRNMIEPTCECHCTRGTVEDESSPTHQLQLELPTSLRVKSPKPATTDLRLAKALSARSIMTHDSLLDNTGDALLERGFFSSDSTRSLNHIELTTEKRNGQSLKSLSVTRNSQNGVMELPACLGLETSLKESPDLTSLCKSVSQMQLKAQNPCNKEEPTLVGRLSKSNYTRSLTVAEDSLQKSPETTRESFVHSPTSSRHQGSFSGRSILKRNSDGNSEPRSGRREDSRLRRHSSLRNITSNDDQSDHKRSLSPPRRLYRHSSLRDTQERGSIRCGENLCPYRANQYDPEEKGLTLLMQDSEVDLSFPAGNLNAPVSEKEKKEYEARGCSPHRGTTPSPPRKQCSRRNVKSAESDTDTARRAKEKALKPDYDWAKASMARSVGLSPNRHGSAEKDREDPAPECNIDKKLHHQTDLNSNSGHGHRCSSSPKRYSDSVILQKARSLRRIYSDNQKASGDRRSSGKALKKSASVRSLDTDKLKSRRILLSSSLTALEIGPELEVEFQKSTASMPSDKRCSRKDGERRGSRRSKHTKDSSYSSMRSATEGTESARLNSKSETDENKDENGSPRRSSRSKDTHGDREGDKSDSKSKQISRKSSSRKLDRSSSHKKESHKKSSRKKESYRSKDVLVDEHNTETETEPEETEASHTMSDLVKQVIASVGDPSHSDYWSKLMDMWEEGHLIPIHSGG